MAVYNIKVWYQTGPGGWTTWAGTVRNAAELALDAVLPGGVYERADGVDVTREQGRDAVITSLSDLESWLAKAPDKPNGSELRYHFYAWGADGNGITPMFENQTSSPEDFLEMMRKVYAEHPDPSRVEVGERLSTLYWQRVQNGHEILFGPAGRRRATRSAVAIAGQAVEQERAKHARKAESRLIS